MPLEKGAKAIDFTLKDDSGNSVSLNDFIGKWLVLYFYPKDDTSDCTIQACDFTNNYERILHYGANVVGISRDNANSHRKFKKKYNLTFSLLADVDKTVCSMYDVLKEKSMFGKKYLGIIRTTYIINPQGIIEYVFNNVDVNGHVEKVIEKLNELTNNND